MRPEPDLPPAPIDHTVRRVSIGRALRRGWPIIVLVTLAAVASSYLAMSRQDTEYEASARLLISPLRQDDTSLFATDLIRDAGDPTSTSTTVAVLIRSNSMAEETARRLGGRWTADSVLDAIEIAPEEGTTVLDVTATAEEPEVAAAVANEYARSVVRLRRRVIERQLDGRYEELEARRRQVPEDDYSQRDRIFTEMRLIRNTLRDDGDPTLRLVDPAVPPSTAAAGNAALPLALGLVGGLALGLAAALAVDLLRRPARSEEPEQHLVAA